MRKAQNIFTHRERKTALWTVLAALGITASLILIEQAWRNPSLGPDGAASYAFAPAPGVLDARPIASAAVSAIR